MARKRKKKITYDSKETSTFLGLVFILLAIVLIISLFTSGQGDGGLLGQSKTLFGSATIFASIYCINVGLRCLGTRYRFNTTPALIGQALLLLVIPALLIVYEYTPQQIVRLNASDSVGGVVGYTMVRVIFGDIIPTEVNGLPGSTKFLLVLMAICFAPLALSMSLKESVNRVKKILGWIWKQIDYALISGREKEEESSSPNEAVLTEKASRFGDFNNLLKARKEQNQKPSEKVQKHADPDIEINTSEQLALIPKTKPRPVDIDGVSVKEGELSEDGLNQDSLKYPDWKLPPMSLLTPFKAAKPKEAAINENARIIEQILSSFGIEAKVEDAYIGPSVIQYALNIPLGVKVAKVATLNENIALALGVDSKAVRVETIPDTTYLGIEVPRSNRDMVRIKELMTSEQMTGNKRFLPVPIGKDIHGETVVAGIEKMPHLLIAGATGSGKSVLTNSFITSIIMRRTPDEVKFILVDPKQVELIDYDGIPHLLTPVITDMDKVINALKWAVLEMETRYSVLAKSQVRNIEGYNEKKGFSAMPYIVIVIDEMADMMMTANRVDAENNIVRLAQKARAVGIHLILATQRPSVNVITGIIKANIPGRIGMSVTSSTDSRVILDRMGAESLMGQGDLLYKAPDKTKSARLQAAFIEQDEVIRVVQFIKDQAPEVEYINEITEKKLSPEEQINEAMGDISGDNLIEQAIRVVVQSQKGSSSYLQRRLNIGFNRAARLLEELEEAGVVGPANGSKPREVLISDADGFIEQLRGGN